MTSDNPITSKIRCKYAVLPRRVSSTSEKCLFSDPSHECESLTDRQTHFMLIYIDFIILAHKINVCDHVIFFILNLVGRVVWEPNPITLIVLSSLNLNSL